MKRPIALATAVLTAAALSTGISWSSAASAAIPAASTPPVDKSVNLPVGTVTGMVLLPATDQTPGLAVVSGTKGVVSVSLDSATQTLLPNLNNVQKMAIGPDGLIYASELAQTAGARTTPNQIQSFDPATGAVASTWPTGAAGCPNDIAFAGSELWFAYACNADGTRDATSDGIAHLNRTDGTVVLATNLATSHPIRIASIPGTDHTGELIAADSYTNPSANKLSLLTVSGTTATATTQIPTSGYESHLSVTPDGSTVTLSSMYDVRSYSTTDLSQVGQTLFESGANSAALSADGRHLAIASSNNGHLMTWATSPGLSALRDYPGDAGLPYDVPAPEGLAWNGDTLLAAYSSQYSETSQLRVLNSELQAPSAMSLRSASAVGRAKALLVTGHLAAATGSSAGGESVLVAKRDAAGAHPIGIFTTDAAGMYRFTDVPAVGGLNTYVAVFSGDKTHAPVTSVNRVNVLRGTVPLLLTLSASTYSYGQLAHLIVRLGSHDVKRVQVWAKLGSQPLHYLATLTVNSKGLAAMNFPMAYNTIFVVKFFGDYYYNARVITSTVHTRVAMAIALAGDYGSDGAYKLFHRGSKVYQGAIAVPDKSGSCLRFEAQEYYNGVWTTVATLDCGTNESGVSVAVFTGGPAGRPFRARAVFPGDAVNDGNTTAWVYFVYR